MDERQRNYLKIKKSKYHEANGKQNMNSLLNYNPKDNLNELKLLYFIFIYNITRIKIANIFDSGYIGKEFFKTYTSDLNEPVDFSNFAISYNDLREIILHSGCYLPIVVFDNSGVDTVLECVHSKYQTKVLMDLYDSGQIDEREVLYLKKDLSPSQISFDMLVPKLLYDEVICHLLLETKNELEDYVTVAVNNRTDLWLIFKVLHKEVSCLIARHGKELYELDIKPARSINLGVKR